MLDTNENRKVWLKYAETKKEEMANDIEKYRKGYCKVRFTDAKGNPIKGKKVKINQKTHDFKYGANIFMLDEFSDDKLNERYRESFKKYFNLATVPFYWKDLEPEKGKPRYDKNSPKIYRRPAPELCVEYCEQNGVLPKLHCLVYEAFVADWTPKQDMEAMEKLYDERFREISERFSGRMYEFEVLNELLVCHSWEKASIICRKKDMPNWAFDLAKKHFPNETLVFNEAQPLFDLATKKFLNPYYLLLENTILKGARVDKIGVQHHAFTGAATKTDEEYENAVKNGNEVEMFNPEIIRSALDVLETLDRSLEITEITVPTFGETTEDEELQADLLELLYTALFSHRSLETAVYWNLPDGYAYVSQSNWVWNENKCRGGLFHHDMTPKKSAERLFYLFNEKWHTDFEAETDKNGYIEFRGFYGEYTASLDGKEEIFSNHKNNSEPCEIII